MLKEKFKKFRELAGLSQQEVATKAGLSWSLIVLVGDGEAVQVVGLMNPQPSVL
jgi:DNA-binding XRE family transcriptional regulator